MTEDTPGNDELARLLRDFDAPSPARADAARRAFYHGTVKTFDRQALFATGYNHELAKQAMQEAWIKIMGKAGSYDPARSKVMTWANTIIVRCAMDELRTHYKHHKSPATTDAAADGPDAPGTPWMDAPEHEDTPLCPTLPAEEGVYQDQVARITALCIEALPSNRGPNYRLAMELALDPDLSYADMTAAIQQHMPGETINPEQVRGWVRYAVKRMRACVSGRLGWNSPGGRHG